MSFSLRKVVRNNKVRKMKKLGLAIISGSILMACGTDGPQLSEELKRNIAVRDSLKGEVAKINEMIAEFESKIADLDSTIKLTPVTTEKSLVKTFEHYFEVHGNVESEENATLFAAAPGIVQKIHVQVGQAVKKGQLIISLDAGTAKSGLEELEKAYELASKVFEKQSSLWEQKIGSEIQYLEAKNNKEGLEQKIKTVKEQVDLYSIKAPFDGIVDDIMPKIGEAASPGFPVARVLNLSKVYLESDVSESYINTVSRGGIVKVFFPSVNEEVLVKITKASNFINPANRTFKVRVEFPNANGKFKPNQLAIMRIRDFVADSAVIIPSKVIQQDRKGNSYVYTVAEKSGKQVIEKLMIKVGKSYQGETMILEGLSSGQVYVDKGSRSVQAGDEVEVKK